MTRAQKDQLVLARGMVVENQHRLLVHRRAVKVLDEQLRRRVENEKEVTSMGVQMGEHGSVQRLAERSVEVVEPDEIDDVGGGWWWWWLVVSEIVDVEKGAMEERREGVEKVREKRSIGESFGGENDNGGCLSKSVRLKACYVIL